MPKLNGLQWFLIVSSVLSAMAGATAQLTEIFGAGVAHTIVSVATFGNMMITAIMTPLVGNISQLKNVASLDGVKVKVDTTVEPAIAKLAVDQTQPNIGAADPADRPKLQEIAKG